MTLYELNQLIRRSKTHNHSQVTGFIEPLLPAAQELINIGSGADGTPITITVEDLWELMGTNALVSNTYYIVTGANTALYNGTDILLRATSTSTISANCVGKFYNPQYTVYSMWDPNASYSVNDIVIYGGYVWQNLTGEVSTANDNFSLNSTDWQKLPTVAGNYYNEVWDDIVYDAADDFIVSRYEASSNNFVSSSIGASYWFWCAVMPIQMFRWGHPFNGNTGVGNCQIINSYINNLNFIGGYMLGIEMTNFSYAYNITMKNNSYIQALKMDNASYITGLELDNSGFYNNTITNSSSIQDIHLISSNMYQVSLNNGAGMFGINAANSSMASLNINNQSVCAGVEMSSSNFYAFDFDNYSWFYGHALTNSNYTTLRLSNSGFGNHTLNNSSVIDIDLFDSGFYYINVTNSYFVNIELNGFNLNYNSYTVPPSFGSLSAATFKFGTIVYQFSFSFNGSEGYGTPGILDTQLYPVPNGFFIEKVLIDKSALSLSAAEACINLGISGADPASGINDTTGLVSAMNVPQLFDMSNGKVSMAKANQDTILAMSVSNTDETWGTINSGTIAFEVTLKNINYSISND